MSHLHRSPPRPCCPARPGHSDILEFVGCPCSFSPRTCSAVSMNPGSDIVWTASVSRGIRPCDVPRLQLQLEGFALALFISSGAPECQCPCSSDCTPSAAVSMCSKLGSSGLLVATWKCRRSLRSYSRISAEVAACCSSKAQKCLNARKSRPPLESDPPGRRRPRRGKPRHLRRRHQGQPFGVAAEVLSYRESGCLRRSRPRRPITCASHPVPPVGIASTTTAETRLELASASVSLPTVSGANWPDITWREMNKSVSPSLRLAGLRPRAPDRVPFT